METAMQDSATLIDTSFEQWTQLSDAYERHLLRMKPGDENARKDAIRLACELDALTRLLGRNLATSQQR
jgi:hypothetical protein